MPGTALRASCVLNSLLFLNIEAVIQSDSHGLYGLVPPYFLLIGCLGCSQWGAGDTVSSIYMAHHSL